MFVYFDVYLNVAAAPQVHSASDISCQCNTVIGVTEARQHDLIRSMEPTDTRVAERDAFAYVTCRETANPQGAITRPASSFFSVCVN